MEVANAGMYDGATSLAEAALMACRVTRRTRVAVVNTTSPTYLQVIEDLLSAPHGIQVDPVSPESPNLDESTACLVVQYPNFFGYIEDLEKALRLDPRKNRDYWSFPPTPSRWGCSSRRGHYGADIVAGEGQPLGIPPSFGGPYLGLFAAKQVYIRQMPSRLSGRTVGPPGPGPGTFLTLQNPGAAYSPGASHQQYLHQRGPSTPWQRTILPGGPGQTGPATGRGALLPKGPLRGLSDRPIARVLVTQFRGPSSRNSWSSVPCPPPKSTGVCWNTTSWAGLTFQRCCLARTCRPFPIMRYCFV